MRTTGLLLAAILAPATLHADGRIYQFNNYCTTGALVSCASVSVSVALREGGGTVLLITMQNLQGTHPADNTAGSLLVGVDVTFPRIPYLDDSTEDDDSGPNGWWSVEAPETNILDGGQGYGGPIFDWWFTSRSVSWNGVATYSGVAGCSPPPSGHIFPAMADTWIGAVQTCPQFGAPGSLVFRFETPTYSWAGEEVEVNWGFVSLGGESGCQPGVNCFATPTPEPTTLVLTTTGLAALIIARRRRHGGPHARSN